MLTSHSGLALSCTSSHGSEQMRRTEQRTAGDGIGFGHHWVLVPPPCSTGGSWQLEGVHCGSCGRGWAQLLKASMRISAHNDTLSRAILLADGPKTGTRSELVLGACNIAGSIWS